MLILEPVVLVGEGEYNLDNLKEVKVVDHSVIFPRGVVHRVENGWGLTTYDTFLESAHLALQYKGWKM